MAVSNDNKMVYFVQVVVWIGGIFGLINSR